MTNDRYSPIDAFPNETCTACDEGQHQVAEGATACEDCPAGRYQSGTGQWQCVSCPNGEYSSSPGSTECLDCGAGYVRTCSGVGVLAWVGESKSMHHNDVVVTSSRWWGVAINAGVETRQLTISAVVVVVVVRVGCQVLFDRKLVHVCVVPARLVPGRQPNVCVQALCGWEGYQRHSTESKCDVVALGAAAWCSIADAENSARFFSGCGCKLFGSCVLRRECKQFNAASSLLALCTAAW